LGAVPTSDSSLATLLEDGPSFRRILHANLETWKEARYRAVWLKIPTEHAALIIEAVREGFVFHHAETTHAVLVTWLPRLDLPTIAADWDRADSMTEAGAAAAERARLVQRAVEYVESTPLPANASHQVGVGCVVIHPRDAAASPRARPRILAVQERRGPLRGKGVWKMPTGLVGQGEDLADGAVREVLEETGVRTAFRGVVAIRHAHGALHDKSDMFYVCLLEALPQAGTAAGEDIPIEMQREELDACAWLDLAEYLDQERYRGSPLYTRINEAITAAVAGAGAAEAPMFVHSKLPYGYSYYKGSDCSLYHSSHLVPAPPPAVPV
jgi:ADP-ribose pyrophosphatase YjhB (NUDIX family)